MGAGVHATPAVEEVEVLEVNVKPVAVGVENVEAPHSAPSTYITSEVPVVVSVPEVAEVVPVPEAEPSRAIAAKTGNGMNDKNADKSRRENIVKGFSLIAFLEYICGDIKTTGGY